MRAWLKRNRPDLFAIFGAVAVFVAIAAYQIELPGLNHDEAMPIVPAMQLLLGQPVDALAAINLCGRSVPLMLMHYVGAISGLLVLPFFVFLGPGLISLRVYEIALSVLSLVLIYLFAREFVNRSVAALTVFLVAITPSFVFWGRVGIIPLLPVLVWGVAALLCLYRWHRGRGHGYLYAGTYLLGLGFTTYMTFLWYILALLLAQVVLERRLLFLKLGSWLPRSWRGPHPKSQTCSERSASIQNPKSIVLSGSFFALGAAPPLWYNLTTQGTLRLVSRSLIHTELYGTNNLDFATNFLRALDDFRQFLDGSEFIWQAGYAYTNPLSVLIFVLAVSYLIIQGLRGRLTPPISARKVTFLLVMLTAILVQSAFTLTSLNIIHLLILFPFPQMLIAIAITHVHNPVTTQPHPAPLWGSGMRPPEQFNWSRVIFAALIAFDLAVDVQYHQAFARTGGVGAFSNAINDLAVWLEQEHIEEPLAVDWGFERNVQLLTRGKINPRDIFEYRHEPGEEFKKGLSVHFRNPGRHYLFHTPEYTHFRGHFDAFLQTAVESHKTPILEKTFVQADGRPVYQVYRVEETPPLFQLPPMQQRRDAVFADRITLLGFDLQPSTFNLQLTLYWQVSGNAPPTTNYTTFIHLVSLDGKTWAQTDHPPVYGSYPTTRWQPGEIIPDPYTLVLPPALPPGTYQIRAGLYDPATGNRLPIWDPQNDAEGNSVMLAQVQPGE